MSPRSKVSVFTLKKQKLPLLIEKLIQVLIVYGPVAQKTQYKFDIITEGKSLRLDYDTTILPPKKYFFPPKQVTLTFSQSPNLEIHDPLNEEAETPSWNGKKFLVFGVHSCDLSAIKFHDRILTQIYPDPFREKRRREGIILGLNCLTPCQESFCKSAGSLNAIEPADIMITDNNDSYLFEVITDIGHKIIDYAKELFIPTRQSLIKDIRNKLAQREKDFPDPLKEFKKIPGQIEACYEGEMWNRLGRRCFGCGACTLVCPTCFCFDVHDEVELNLKGGSRVRTWDSCQLVDFALVAGGHNFRPTISSRTRFRIYHKFWTEPEQIDQIGCVGCGRCTRTCPADIDMIELLTNIQKGGN